MITKYIYATTNGNGFITHEDQEIDGLSFEILFIKDSNIFYTKVTGEDAKVSNWITRISGTETTLDEINSLIAAANNQPVQP